LNRQRRTTYAVERIAASWRSRASDLTVVWRYSDQQKISRATAPIVGSLHETESTVKVPNSRTGLGSRCGLTATMRVAEGPTGSSWLPSVQIFSLPSVEPCSKRFKRRSNIGADSRGPGQLEETPKPPAEQVSRKPNPAWPLLPLLPSVQILFFAAFC
jgi:hypothetical protein